MVAHTRKTPGPGALRPVTAKSVAPAVTPKTGGAGSGAQFRPMNLPAPIEVVEDGSERPISVTLPLAIARRPSGPRSLNQKDRGMTGSLTITSINDLWQVDDEWWREHPISRRYYQVTTQDERRLTIFKDQLNGSWYWQKGGVEAVS